MSEDKRYNGWTNYETWNVKLWIDNDEGSYRYWQEVAQEVYDEAEPQYDWETKDSVFRVNLANRMKEEFEEQAQEVLGRQYSASVWADLLGAALSEVNWQEIAESYMEDIERNDAETEEQES